jgi:hypothetical protein
MTGQPGQDDPGGLSPSDDRVLTVWLMLAALSPEQLRQFAEWARLADAD